MKTSKIEKKVVPAASREEFMETVDEIARLDVERQKLEAELASRHQEIDDKYGTQLDDVKKRIDALMEKAKPYFVDHQEELCAKGQKQGETKLALFGIRTGMPKLVKKVKTALKALAGDWFLTDALTPFVSVAYDINKERVIQLWKDDREKFNATIPKSITVTQEDSFWVEPKADEQV